jgi:outer membrane protein OmpA-like peptidoglycan-associated protein
MKARLQTKHLLAYLAGSVLIVGCGTQLPKEKPEDGDVAARCTPVRALLSKNVRSGANVAFPWLFNVGGLYERSGAVLDAAEAARTVRLDEACRAWVGGAITAKEYGRVVLDNTSATIVQTTSPDDREDVTHKVMEYLDDLKTKGYLPDRFDTSAIPGQVKSDAHLSNKELEAKLRDSLDELGGRLRLVGEAADVREAQLASRFDLVERRLKVLETAAKSVSAASISVPTSRPTGPDSAASSAGTQAASSGSGDEYSEHRGSADVGTRALDVYFSTGSAELSLLEKQRLESAAAVWRSAGATLYVMGFADPRGSAAFNSALARARAESVAKLLLRSRVKVGAVSSGGTASGADQDTLRYVHLLGLGFNPSSQSVQPLSKANGPAKN